MIVYIVFFFFFVFIFLHASIYILHCTSTQYDWNNIGRKTLNNGVDDDATSISSRDVIVKFYIWIFVIKEKHYAFSKYKAYSSKVGSQI